MVKYRENGTQGGRVEVKTLGDLVSDGRKHLDTRWIEKTCLTPPPPPPALLVTKLSDSPHIA